MKRRALPMALTVVVAAAVVIGGLTFSRFVQESLWQESVTDVLEVTSQGRHALDAYPVSYTHLDVYKRQMITRPSGRLYTAWGNAFMHGASSQWLHRRGR